MSLGLADPAWWTPLPIAFCKQASPSISSSTTRGRHGAAALIRNAHGEESQFAINHLGHFQLTAQFVARPCAMRTARASWRFLGGGICAAASILMTGTSRRREYDRAGSLMANRKETARSPLCPSNWMKRSRQAARCPRVSSSPGRSSDRSSATYVRRGASAAAGAIDDDGEPIRPSGKQSRKRLNRAQQ